jgi:hypothetical protein
MIDLVKKNCKRRDRRHFAPADEKPLSVSAHQEKPFVFLSCRGKQSFYTSPENSLLST